MSLKRNVLANFGGSAWSALMNLAFVPLYIKLMGVESYGIVGVFASLVGMLVVLDLGLSQGMTREMALLSTDKKNVHRLADTARTLEIVYWCLAFCVALAIVLLSQFIAYRWLKPVQLSRESLLHALWIMALVIGLRWPVAIYSGGLNGLQRQVLVNVILIVFATLQGAGALAVLWFIEPSIHAFFFWQALIALLQVAVLRLALWRSLSPGIKGQFREDVLRKIWRFAAGMSGISLTAAILTQLDKVLLSRILTLTEFGYYVFASVIAGALYKVIGPIFVAYYPRLTELVANDDQLSLTRTYHQACQLMAIAIVPAALMLVFFSSEILMLWTNSLDIVTNSSLLVSLLVVGSVLHGFMNMPFALQLAHGWTKLAFYLNLAAVVILTPSIYFATFNWGAVGAAGAWIVLNGTYVLIGVQLTHRRLLPAEKWRWYFTDFFVPFTVGATTALALRQLPLPQGPVSLGAALIGITLLVMIAVTFAVPAGRTRLTNFQRYVFNV
jgi:O-antigen/teichoic acid export membrane protein